jgi:WD40 repeat protein
MDRITPLEAGIQASNEFYIVGGTVPSKAPCYIVRRADAELHAAIRAGRFCYVLTARQMGKSSLVNRVATQLCAEGSTVAQIDLTSIGQNLTIEQWYDGLLYELGRELGLKAALRDCWRAHADLGPMHRFLIVLRECVLPQCNGPVVIFVDEIEVVRSLPFSTDEFFAAIRECYNRRAHDPEMKRLTFCIVGMATPSELIKDAKITPFNIGQQVDLDDFTLDEAQGLAFGLQPRSDRLKRHQAAYSFALLNRVFYWTHGHPYLTQRLCSAVSTRLAAADLDPAVSVAEPMRLPRRFLGPGARRRDPTTNLSNAERLVDRVCADLFLSTRAREVDTNLVPIRQYLLRDDSDRAALLGLYSRVRAGRRVTDDRTDPLLTQLRLSGVVRLSRGRFYVRNRIYEQVFGPAWVLNSMPDAELRRQRVAFQRGAVRSASVFGILLAIMSGLALEVGIQARTAQRREQESRRLIYAADMNFAQQMLQQHNPGKAQTLLTSHRADEQRGFEWSYLWKQSHLERFVLRASTSLVYSVAFSPDGRQLVTGDADGSVRVWSAATGQAEATLTRGGSVFTVRYTSTGDLLAVGTQGEQARLWGGANASLSIAALKGAASYRTTACSARRFVVADENTARVLEIGTPAGAVTTIDCGQRIGCLALSPDSRFLAVGVEDGSVQVWDLITGKRTRRLAGHGGFLDAIAFSPDGRLLVAGSGNKAAYLWDVATGRDVGRFSGHLGAVTAVAVSSDDRWLATGGEDQSVRVWDIQTGETVEMLDGHRSSVSSVAFSPDGRWLASGSFDHTARVWNLAAKQETLKIRPFPDHLWRGLFAPGGERLAARYTYAGDSGNTAQLWDTVHGIRISTFTDPEHRVGTLAFSPDGRRLAIGRQGRGLCLYDAATGRELPNDPAAGIPVDEPLAFSPDGRWLAAGNGRQVRLWSLRQRGWGRSFDAEPEGKVVTAAAFSPDSMSLAVVGEDADARVWRVDSSAPPTVLSEHQKLLQTVAFSPDGKTLMTGGDDAMLKLWNIATGREMLTLTDEEGGVLAGAFSSNGALLRSVDRSGTIRLWRAAEKNEIEPSERALSN